LFVLKRFEGRGKTVRGTVLTATAEWTATEEARSAVWSCNGHGGISPSPPKTKDRFYLSFVFIRKGFEGQKIVVSFCSSLFSKIVVFGEKIALLRKALNYIIML
jgi:hypothetical protein